MSRRAQAESARRLGERLLRALCGQGCPDADRARVDALQANPALRELIETAPLPVVALDTSGRVRIWNPAAARTFGWRRAEVLGRRLPFVPPSERAAQRRLMIGSMRGSPLRGVELHRLRRDGVLLTVRLWTAPVIDAAGRQVGVFGLYVDLTDLRRGEAALRTSEARLQALNARLHTLREEERQHLARELHDTFGHTLTEWKFDLAWLSRRLARKGLSERSPVRRRLSAMSRRADGAMNAVRRICGALRPPLLDTVGLAPAIQELVRSFEARTRVRCRAALPELPVPMDDARSTALYRILQELLDNVTRHARARSVSIRLAGDAHAVTLRVRDDGRGLPVGALTKPSALGLLGMRERAAALGGELVIGRARPRGTLAVVRLPLAAAPEGGST